MTEGELVTGVLNRTLQKQPGPRLEELKPFGVPENSRLEGKCNVEPVHDRERKPPFSPTHERSATHPATGRHREVGSEG